MRRHNPLQSKSIRVIGKGILGGTWSSLARWERSPEAPHCHVSAYLPENTRLIWIVSFPPEKGKRGISQNPFSEIPIAQPIAESSQPARNRTYLHETPQKTKTNMHKIRAPKPSSVSSEQEQTHPRSHPLVEDTPAEDLLVAGGCKFVQGGTG